MSNSLTLDSVLRGNRQLIEAGAALHWLVPRDKRPVEGEWTSKPRYTLDQLQSSYKAGNNIGLRTGEPSKVGDLYLHVLDVDIRKPEMASEAWHAVSELFPDHRNLPSVVSGSGGESRHLYFFSNAPFRSKKLVRSAGFEYVFDAKKDRNVKKYDWEIDLKGSGTQLVLPPSIHPDTGKPYYWERELDLDFAFLYEVSAERISEWGVRKTVAEIEDDDDLGVLVRNEPLDISDSQVEDTLDELPEEYVEDRDLWVQVGMALHHQYRGADEGFDIWCEWSKQSEKFDEKESRKIWKSFGDTRNPVRFSTVISAAKNSQLVMEVEDAFDAPSTDLEDLLGDAAPVPATKPASIADLTKPDPNWQQKLHRNEEGELKTTLPNIKLIIENDPRSRGIVAFNEFTQEIARLNEPKRVKKKRDSSHEPVNLTGEMWRVGDKINGDAWLDVHDAAVREMIETKSNLQGYGIKVSDRDLRSAIDICAQKKRYHPVRDLLDSLEWNGTPRVETVFIDYLGCDDTPYYRQAALMTLVGAVARVYEPGCKFDFVPILEGTQGKGKSTFIRILGLDWYSELQGDIGDNNKMIEAMQGAWILELGELSAMSRSDVNDLKAFVTRQVDKGRLAYAKRVGVYPRQCIFMGSTNDKEYLRDMTGGRRFWPIECNIIGQIDNVKLRKNVKQIWAEAVVIYKRMREQYRDELPLYLKDDAAEGAVVMQESRRVETAEEVLAGKIMLWLDTPIGDEFDDADPDAEKQYRNETCIQQIWNEVMDRQGEPRQMDAILIGKAMQIVGWSRSKGVVGARDINKKYGRCRVYTRNSE